MRRGPPEGDAAGSTSGSGGAAGAAGAGSIGGAAEERRRRQRRAAAITFQDVLTHSDRSTFAFDSFAQRHLLYGTGPAHLQVTVNVYACLTLCAVGIFMSLTLNPHTSDHLHMHECVRMPRCWQSWVFVNVGTRQRDAPCAPLPLPRHARRSRMLRC